MSERAGIEIDYCPQCRGVWLDRGELDKIIARSTGDEVSRPEPRAAQVDSRGFGHHGGHHKDDREYHHRKKSIWHELFD